MRSPAFTIIEVLMALGLIVASVSIVANLQMRSLDRVLRDRDAIEKTFVIKREHYSHFLKPPKTTKKFAVKLDEPPLALTTIVDKISAKSSLGFLKDNLRTIRTDAVWKLGKHERDARMVTFVFSPKEKEKEKK